MFASLYLLVAVISLICSTEFFALAHSGVMSWVLAIGFEVGAMSCLLSTLILPREKQALVWIMFVILTLFQCMSNTYMAYSHLENFSGWVELFGLNELEPIAQKRILASISGAILPLVALGFIRIMANVLQNKDGAQTNFGLADEQLPENTDAEPAPAVPEDVTLEQVPTELEPDEYADEIAEINESWSEEPLDKEGQYGNVPMEEETVEEDKPVETEETVDAEELPEESAGNVEPSDVEEPIEAEETVEVEESADEEVSDEQELPDESGDLAAEQADAAPEQEKPAVEKDTREVGVPSGIGTEAPSIPRRIWNPSTNKYM